jgi:hypothetical protein
VIKSCVEKTVLTHIFCAAEDLSLSKHKDESEDGAANDPNHYNGNAEGLGIVVVFSYPTLHTHIDGQVCVFVIKDSDAIVDREGYCGNGG